MLALGIILMSIACLIGAGGLIVFIAEAINESRDFKLSEIFWGMWDE